MLHEHNYLSILARILAQGEKRQDRTGTGTKALFGEKMVFPLVDGFPLFTTKKMFFPGVVDELLWFISGSTNINDLPERTRQWWTPWADPINGSLGPIYGEQLRCARWWGQDTAGNLVMRTSDQLMDVVKSLKENPDSRRHIINLWHTPAMKEARLPCCHGAIIQFYVSVDGYLSCQMYQRSADMFLGVPVNVASYSLLTMMLAQVCGYMPGMFIWIGGDCHLYLNHLGQAWKQLERTPRKAPSLVINPAIKDITTFTYDDFTLIGYEPWPAIKAPLAV